MEKTRSSTDPVTMQQRSSTVMAPQKSQYYVCFDGKTRSSTDLATMQQRSSTVLAPPNCQYYIGFNGKNKIQQRCSNDAATIQHGLGTPKM